MQKKTKRSQRLETSKARLPRLVTPATTKAVNVHVVPGLEHVPQVPAPNRLTVVPEVAHPEDRHAPNPAVVVDPLHLNGQTLAPVNPSREVVLVRGLVLVQDPDQEVDTQDPDLEVEVQPQIDPIVDHGSLEVGVHRRHRLERVEDRTNRSHGLDQDLAVEAGQVVVKVVRVQGVGVEVDHLSRGNLYQEVNIREADQMSNNAIVKHDSHNFDVIKIF